MYSSRFYCEMDHATAKSAKKIVSLLLEKFQFQTVVDFGGGTGKFARELLLLGKNDVLIVEGDWLKGISKWVPEEMYLYTDLRKQISFQSKYDLAICLEVAEHLEAEYADTLIANLTASSDIVAFSAAIPGQGGTHHINEQWPDYWVDKFKTFGYGLSLDPRIEIWDDDEILACYRQNLLFFTKKPLLDLRPSRLVHPDIWIQRVKSSKIKLWIKVFSLFPETFRTKIVRASKIVRGFNV
jgi:hypothetical protein